jgi:hypothetical protein
LKDLLKFTGFDVVVAVGPNANDADGAAVVAVDPPNEND